MRYGLPESDIKSIIQGELDRNPDLKYYINNPYFDEYMSLLIDGISKAVVENSKNVISDIECELRIKGKA